MPQLTLRMIDPENWRIRLSVREDQRHHVSDQWRILARAYAYRERHSQALYVSLDDTPIGMLLYHDGVADDCYDLSQFFIDQRWQGRGYGYAAMRLLLDALRRDGRYDRVELCYCAGDEPARRLYEKCGFTPTGVVDEGEIIMALNLYAVKEKRE